MMKITLFIASFVIASAAQAAVLDYYKEGAICDKKAGFCADFMGVSVGITKMYLGDKAEKKLMAEINKVGLDDFDATTFTMSGGLTCETKKSTCWTSRNRDRVDTKATKTLFGK
jgi:hypothetical protein